MNNHELISVPEHIKAPAMEVGEVSSQELIETPEHIKAAAEAPQEAIAVDVIEQAPFNVEVNHTQHAKLGQGVLKGLIEVPGVTDSGTYIIPGTQSAGQTRQVVSLGSLDDFKGGNPGNVIGFDGIVRK